MIWRIAASLAVLASAAAPAAPPLTAYIDKYPFDSVDGVTFNSHPLVRRLVTEATNNKGVLANILSDGTAGPITRQGSVIVSWACEPHNCGPHNWTIAILNPAAPAAICYYDDELMTQPVWLFGGFKRLGGEKGCPHTAEDIPSRILTALAAG